MKKMKLDLARLAVETFNTTDPAPAPRGTIRAHDSETGGIDCTGWTNCGSITCAHGCASDTGCPPATQPLDNTCYKTCVQTT